MRKNKTAGSHIITGKVLFGLVTTRRKVEKTHGKSNTKRATTHHAALFIDTSLVSLLIREITDINFAYSAYQSTGNKGQTSLENRANLKVDKAIARLNKDFGYIYDFLVAEAHLSNGETLPYLNPIYFSRSGKNMKYFWRLADCLQTFYGLERGKVAGRTPGSTQYSQKQLKDYTRNRRRLGSYRAIEKSFPEHFTSDVGDPFPRLKAALSRLRNKVPTRSLEKSSGTSEAFIRKPPYPIFIDENQELPPHIRFNNLRNS